MFTVYQSANIFTVVSAFLEGCVAVIFKKVQKTCVLWMAADLCGPLGDVIQQNLKSGHAVSEVSLEHPTACCWHLLKPIHDSFIMINAQWTFEIKVANGHSLSQPNLELFLIWKEETSGTQTSEKEMRMLLCMNFILQQLQTDSVGLARKIQLSWHEMWYNTGVEIDAQGQQLWYRRALYLQYLQHTLCEALVFVCVDNMLDHHPKQVSHAWHIHATQCPLTNCTFTLLCAHFQN